MMNKSVIFFIILLFSNSISAKECFKFIYGELVVHTTLIFDEKKEFSNKNLIINWSDNLNSGIWTNNEFVAGSINKNLNDYFGISTLSSINILNSLGQTGWEAVSHSVVGEVDARVSMDQWYFKKCL